MSDVEGEISSTFKKRNFRKKGGRKRKASSSEGKVDKLKDIYNTTLGMFQDKLQCL